MTNLNIPRPEANDYAPFYAGYVSMVPETDIIKVLKEQPGEIGELIRDIPEDRAGFRYAPEKWSIREVIGHIGDAERVFSYRALRFARGDSTELSGFDSDEYVRRSDYDQWPLAELAAGFEALRKANVLLFEHLSEEAWTRDGVANGNRVTLPGLAYVMAGHVRHHMRVLKERYL